MAALSQGFELMLGLRPLETELLILSVLSLQIGRTIVRNGVLHLTLFAVYLFTVIVP